MDELKKSAEAKWEKNRYDKNVSFHDFKEFIALEYFENVDLTELQTEKLCRAADRNGDGRVTLVEWKRFYARASSYSGITVLDKQAIEDYLEDIPE